MLIFTKQGEIAYNMDLKGILWKENIDEDMVHSSCIDAMYAVVDSYLLVDLNWSHQILDNKNHPF